MNNKKIILALCFTGLFLMGCIGAEETQDLDKNATIANPASVYCVENGGTLDLERGLCMFPNGAECEEWAYYRNLCSPYNQTVTPTPMANESELDESDFLIDDETMPNLLTDTELIEEPNDQG